MSLDNANIDHARRVLETLRWHKDMIVINDYGETVWLKALLSETGIQIGITDCCFAGKPCKYHASIPLSWNSLCDAVWMEAQYQIDIHNSYPDRGRESWWCCNFYVPKDEIQRMWERIGPIRVLR